MSPESHPFVEKTMEDSREGSTGGYIHRPAMEDPLTLPGQNEHIWVFPKIGGFPQQPWVFLIKMIKTWGWRLGVPPFKETAISHQSDILSPFNHQLKSCAQLFGKNGVFVVMPLVPTRGRVYETLLNKKNPPSR